MFFSPRISLKRLAELCRRLGTSLEAGIDVRTVWRRELERARGRAARRRFGSISEAVDSGDTLADTLAGTGSYFPELFREMAGVGEQTGHQAEVFHRLADHYQGQLELRRVFLAAIAGPMVQLVLAVLIIGFLIWIMGLIQQWTGTEVDPLGLGLVGNQGLLIYVTFLAAVVVLIWLIVQAVRRGMVWTRPIQRLVLRLPWLGKPLQTVALARLAWSMYLTMNAGMPVGRALKLSVKSTRNARYTDGLDQIEASIAAGNSIDETFRTAGVYPVDFLDALAVGEQSGKLVESMALLSRQYRDQARAALATLTMLAGVAVWIAIALLIIAMIFRLFMFYLGAIYDAMAPM